MKGWICVIAGALGGVVAAAFGGWTFLLTALCILMGVDYISGLVVAGVFHKSPKSQNGGLESHAGLKGLIRKIGTLCLVMVAHLIDRLLGTEYIRDATTIAFSINEIISILENAGLMGIKMPAVLVKALDVLRQKAGENGGNNDKEETPHPSAAPTPSPEGEGFETNPSTAFGGPPPLQAGEVLETEETGPSSGADAPPSPEGEGLEIATSASAPRNDGTEEIEP